MRTPEVFRIELSPKVVQRIDELASRLGASRHSVLTEAVGLGITTIEHDPDIYRGPRAMGQPRVDVRSVRRRVYERIELLTERPGQEISLAEVRTRLTDLPRTEVDDALRVLSHRRFIKLGSPSREPNDLERAAALMNVAGRSLTFAVLLPRRKRGKTSFLGRPAPPPPVVPPATPVVPPAAPAPPTPTDT